MRDAEAARVLPVQVAALAEDVFVPVSWYFGSKWKSTSPRPCFQRFCKPVSARAFWRTSSSV